MATTCEYRINIEAAVKKTPRVLFRFWHSDSGGDPRLNTIDAITPRAFLPDNHKYQLDSFFDIPKEELANTARRHVHSDRSIQTTFSSWSQSLGLVLSLARQSDVNSTIHISILDTSKLPSANVVLHSSFMKSHIDTSIPDYHVEYLIFGVIKGDTYESRPLSLFNEALTRPFTVRLQRWRGTIFDNATHPFDESKNIWITYQGIEAAITLGNLYGGEFAMPFAAHLLGLRCKHLLPRQRAHFTSRLAAMSIPPKWAADSSIMSLENIFTNKFWESEVAALLIKEAVQTKYP